MHDKRTTTIKMLNNLFFSYYYLSRFNFSFIPKIDKNFSTVFSNESFEVPPGRFWVVATPKCFAAISFTENSPSARKEKFNLIANDHK